MDTMDEKSTSGMRRRDLWRIGGGVAAAHGLGAAMWGAREWRGPAATADTWHTSVWRDCGTGCGVLLGMRDGRVTAMRGADLAHHQGVMGITGAMRRALPDVQGRLTPPPMRRAGHLVEAPWDAARARVTSAPREGVVLTTLHDAKRLIHRVVADHVDPISKEPEYKGTAVSLSKVMA